MAILSFSVISRQTVVTPTTPDTGETVVPALTYTGEWNAATNVPLLIGSAGTKGLTYKVSVAGSTNLDGNSVWDVGDYVTFNGVTWDRIVGPAIDGAAASIGILKSDGAGTISPASAGTDYVKPDTASVWTKGQRMAPYNLGTITSGWTIDPVNGNIQYMVNGGPHTITAPAVDCAVEIQITNNATAGSLVFSGFSGVIMGDVYDTVNGHVFTLVVRRIAGATRGWLMAWQ